ncbi:hypothetical protein BYT27DRAFT_6400277 [Phlegmacium glaucopus]|nr:hypothetical protein BYT27DRAFT_6400277 [Phlegmacium glaucopus]
MLLCCSFPLCSRISGDLCQSFKVKASPSEHGVCLRKLDNEHSTQIGLDDHAPRSPSKGLLGDPRLLHEAAPGIVRRRALASSTVRSDNFRFFFVEPM